MLLSELGWPGWTPAPTAPPASSLKKKGKRIVFLGLKICQKRREDVCSRYDHAKYFLAIFTTYFAALKLRYRKSGEILLQIRFSEATLDRAFDIWVLIKRFAKCLRNFGNPGHQESAKSRKRQRKDTS